MLIKIKSFFKSVYQKLVLLDDSPHKIAGGLAVGVFLGILPGAGPIASVVVAFILHVNRAAALMGSLLTNTWFSIVTFFLAVRIGAFLTGVDWHSIQTECNNLLEHFSWRELFDVSILKVLKPLLIGYFVVGLVAGVCVYLISLFVVAQYKRIKSHR